MALGNFSLQATLPTNYEYYTSGGISSGLNATGNEFSLNDKLVRIYSGAMHYFRVPRKYWRDRLRKIRAAGLNTVESYVPWNLHEPQSGVYDFGSGGSDKEDFLHLEEFLQTAKEEDLFVIMRSGPYICAEYNFGGFPSWLLREKPMGFRTSETNFMKYVTRYFNVLLPLLAMFQFTKGGPIIAFQVENEYGNQEEASKFVPERRYLEELNQIFIENGIVELLVTSDSPLSHGLVGTLPGTFLMAANLGDSPESQLAKLEEIQPGRPLMVMEYWIGWFDFWGDSKHNGKTLEKTTAIYRRILNYNASVNIYMFHGGTNFGFTNGATIGSHLDNSNFQAITTSYDYDSPLREDGGYTDKYYMVKSLLEQHNPVKTLIPDPPTPQPLIAYDALALHQKIPFDILMGYNAPYIIDSKDVISMEMLPINNNSGQSDGYVVYRKEKLDLTANSTLKISGHVCDTVIVLVNGELVAPKKLSGSNDLNSFGYWRLRDSTVVLNEAPLQGATLELIVENWGRPNGGKITTYNETFKGLWQGGVYVNENKVRDWKIIPLEFKENWVNRLKGWTDYIEPISGPVLYDAVLEIRGEPSDTYLDMRDWSKGCVFVNGIALGKYATIGPQQALYLPAVFLKTGANYIMIFEHFASPSDGMLRFSDKQIFESK